jgi:hypothetical protein
MRIFCRDILELVILDSRTQKLNDDFVESIRAECVSAVENGFKNCTALRGKCAGIGRLETLEKVKIFLARDSA